MDLDLTFTGVQNVDIRFAEDDEQVALAGVLELAGHVQVGVHTGFSIGMRPSLSNSVAWAS